MKKNNLIFGLIAGLIVSAAMIRGMMIENKNLDFDNLIIGYASMLIAFSLVFVAIKKQRDKYNGGVISFGKAFRTGLWITLIASTMYVLTWLIYYYNFIPDFMDRYADHMIAKAKESGSNLAEAQKQAAQMKEMYKNPLLVVLLTY